MTFKNSESVPSFLSKYLKHILFSLIVLASLLYFISGQLSGGRVKVNSIGLPQTDIELPVFGALASFNTKDLEEVRASSLEACGFNVSHYRLSPTIFDQLDEECFWRSKDGYYSEGPETKSVEGVSLDSSFLVNPHLLIYPRFLQGGGLIKSEPKVRRIYYSHSRKTIEAEIDLSSTFTEPFPEGAHISFTPITLNAFDLGYKVFALDGKESSNIESADTGEIFNNFSKYICMKAEGDAMNEIRISSLMGKIVVNKLPAIATFRLWKEHMPSQVPEIPEVDLIFKINFI